MIPYSLLIFLPSAKIGREKIKIQNFETKLKIFLKYDESCHYDVMTNEAKSIPKNLPQLQLALVAQLLQLHPHPQLQVMANISELI